jgi:hypothetical protein
MIIHYVSYRWTDRAGGWSEGRMYSRVISDAGLQFLAHWALGESPWQRPELLTPRGHAI